MERAFVIVLLLEVDLRYRPSLYSPIDDRCGLGETCFRVLHFAVRENSSRDGSVAVQSLTSQKLARVACLGQDSSVFHLNNYRTLLALMGCPIWADLAEWQKHEVRL